MSPFVSFTSDWRGFGMQQLRQGTQLAPRYVFSSTHQAFSNVGNSSNMTDNGVAQFSASTLDEHDEGTQKPNLLDPKADELVLDRDSPGNGGVPRNGTGKTGKSEFPASCRMRRSEGEISDVATDPGSVGNPQQGGRTKIEGSRDGINITVITEAARKGGRIVTGFQPTLRGIHEPGTLGRDRV